MLEAFAIPVLMQAVDFLFEEGSKILQERRERRQAQHKEEKTGPQPGKEGEGTPPPSGAIQSKEELLGQEISAAAWSTYEAEVRHQMSLLEVYTRNYHLAQEQYARWGSALVPPIIVNNLEENEHAIAEIMRKLQELLVKIYGRPVVVPELEGAEEG
jgi:hypothetical protein